MVEKGKKCCCQWLFSKGIWWYIFKAGWYCVTVRGRTTLICLIDQNIIHTPSRVTSGVTLTCLNCCTCSLLFQAFQALVVDWCRKLHCLILSWHAEPLEKCDAWFISFAYMCKYPNTYCTDRDKDTFYKQRNVTGFSRMSVCDMRLQVNYFAMQR